MAYLLSDSGKDDEERDEQSEEYEVHSDGLDVTRDGGPVAVAVQCGAAIASERVEPACHLTDSSPLCNREQQRLLQCVNNNNCQQCLLVFRYERGTQYRFGTFPSSDSRCVLHR